MSPAAGDGPPGRRGGAPPSVEFRRGLPADAELLRDLERDTNVVALAHVFSVEHAFPEAAVLWRWRDELADPDVVVEVVDGPTGLDCYVAADADVVRRLAVRPEAWGRGLGRAALDRASSRMADPALWCLDLNTAAQAFYRRLGWEPTGRSRPEAWPPYPVLSEWRQRVRRV